MRASRAHLVADVMPPMRQRSTASTKLRARCRARDEQLRIEAQEEDKVKMRKQAQQDRKEFLEARSNRLSAWKDFTKAVRALLSEAERFCVSRLRLLVLAHGITG